MGFLMTLLKISVIVVFLLLMAIPFLMEWKTFRKDKERKISFKRARMVVFTLIYVIAVTIVLYLLKEILLWVGSLSAVQWVAGKVAVSSRVQYCITVFGAMLVNVAVGALYVLLSKPVRLGLKDKDLVSPKKKDGKYTLLQKAERAVIKFFNKEIWFFVGQVFQWLFIVLSILYALMFVAYQLPALFGASWIPYEFVAHMFAAGYIYPSITLLAICQIAFFLKGIERLEEECPELSEEETAGLSITEVDLNAIDQEVKKRFGDHYVCDLDLSKSLTEPASTSKHNEMTKYIAAAVEADKRNPQTNKEIYLSCLDRIMESDKSILINGCFASGFSMYFLRYLSILFARGDNAIFVCNSDSEIDATYDYIVQALSEMSSLYHASDSSVNDSFDHPIWKVVKVHADAEDISHVEIDNASVLVTSLAYLCSHCFEESHLRFIHLLDTVVFVDALKTVNTYNRQLTTLNTRLKQIFETNALKAKNGTENEGYRVRYMAKQVRYICFDPSGVSGLDKVLTNLLAVPFDSADCMYFSPGSIVRCYNFEARLNEEGRRNDNQCVNIDEELGAIMNVAVWCRSKGASDVTVLASSKMPFADYQESLAAHQGSVPVLIDDRYIKFNRYHYDPNGYSVILALDTDDDLPVTVRKCACLAGDKPVLVMIFSRRHILREYYMENIEDLWSRMSFERIPVESGTDKDAARRITVMANAGGISTEEILRIVADVPCFSAASKTGDIDGILRKVLEIYGIPHEASEQLYDHFEYRTDRDFDRDGRFNSKCRVYLRENGELYAKVNGKQIARLKVGDRTIPLHVSAKRITQKYIQGQNLLHDGTVYHIYKIDTDEGVVYAERATSGKNDEAYEYIQSREYRIEAVPGKLEPAQSGKHVVFGKDLEDIRVDDVSISVFKAPAEVITRGYLAMDPRTMSWDGVGRYERIDDENDDIRCRQTYRRYGDVSEPTFTTEDVVKDTGLVADSDGILVMHVKISGALGDAPAKAANLAAAILDDVLKLRFPSVAESIAVCPVIKEAFSDEDAKAVAWRHPKLTLVGQSELLKGEGMELVIIEDASTDLGVISGIMSAGSDVLYTLFKPVLTYLQWYAAAQEKNDYLYCGLDHEPSCFDFETLYKVSRLVGDDENAKVYIDIDTVTEYHVCSFCGKKYPKSEKMSKLEDGRSICDECAQHLVGNNKKALKAHLDRARRYLESTYGVVLDDSYDVCFEATSKVISALKKNKDLSRRGSDIPTKAYIDEKRCVHIEHSIPEAAMDELLVRELTHVWQLKHVPNAPEDIAEGHIALVGIQYLTFLGYRSMAEARTRYYESNNDISGKGYRKLVSELVKKPQYRNDPFKYILDATGGSEDDGSIIRPVQPIFTEDDYGLPYVPTQFDRVLSGPVPYFYYDDLTATHQRAYDTILEGIRAHSPQVTVDGCGFVDVEKVVDSIRYDHPELFWFKVFSMAGPTVYLTYGATAEEAAVLQRRIDEVIPKYLEGINDQMSAYDVAIRIHGKLIAAVDYDEIALEKQKKEGGPARDKIDYLRTICGVFLNGKAVCEGYARAMQYLLQKCGVECAEAVGGTYDKKGRPTGAHAWNILKVDGDYYYLDATWDDSSSTVQTVKKTDLGFDYFCVTTDEISRTRDTKLCPTQMPICTAVKANYFYHNDLVIDRYDLPKIKAMGQAAAKAKRTSFTFKCKTKAVYESALDQLCIKGQDCYEVIKAAAKEDKQILSNAYAYSFDRNIWTITVKFRYKQ